MRRYLWIILLVGLLLSLLALAPTAAPFRVETATSAAMAPTIETGDAYVTVPADTITQGDVVVFWASEEGSFLTRSVLDVGERSYLLGTSTDGPSMRGDDGNVTAGDARLVHRSAIVAKVLTIGGHPIVFPGFGDILTTFAAYRFVALFLLLFVLAGAVVRRGLAAGASGQVTIIRVRTVVIPLLAVLFVTCVAITPLSATAYQLTYPVDETGESGLAGGENVTREVSLPVATPPLTRWLLRSEGATVANWTEERGAINATISVPPREAADRIAIEVHLFPYPDWVPTPLLETAHDSHPIVASLLGAVLLVGPIAILYRLFLDGSRPIARVRRHSLYWSRGD